MAREITVPEAKPAFEWILGRAVQKVSPKRRHSLLQSELLARMSAWAKGRGEVGPKASAEAVDELDEGGLLVGEVDVEAPEGRLGEPADFGDRRAVVPLLTENHLRRAKDSLSCSLASRGDRSRPRG